MIVFVSHSLLSLHDHVCVALPYCYCMTVFVSLYKYDRVCVRMLWCHIFRLIEVKKKKSDLKSNIYRVFVLFVCFCFFVFFFAAA